jgi:hypothetical protein
MRDAKAQRGCPSNRRCTLPLVTHSNNSIDRSLPDRQFENFEKCKNPEAKFYSTSCLLPVQGDSAELATVLI